MTLCTIVSIVYETGTHSKKPRTSIQLFYLRHIQPTSFYICQLRKYIFYVSCTSESGIMKNKWFSIIATMVKTRCTIIQQVYLPLCIETQPACKLLHCSNDSKCFSVGQATPRNCTFPLADLAPSNTWFIGPTRVIHPNRCIDTFSRF